MSIKLSARQLLAAIQAKRLGASARTNELGAVISARQLLAAIQARRLEASSRTNELGAVMTLSALEAVMALGIWVQVSLTALLKGDAAAGTDAATLQSNKALSDGAVTPEQVALYIIKTFADSAYTADIFSKDAGSYTLLGDTNTSVDDETLAFIKAVMDAPSVADVCNIVVAFSRQFDDLALTPETLAFDISSAQNELAASADAFSFVQASIRADVAAGLDAAALEVVKAADDLALTLETFGYGLQTDRADFAGLLDSALLAIDKVFADASAVSDDAALTRQQLFDDNVISTDDFDGLSSAEDDQTMQFTKVLPDLALAVENFLLALQAQRDFDDLAAALDGVGLALERALAEPAEATDAAAVALERPLAEQALGGDAASLTFTVAPYFELAAAAELYSQATDKTLVEQPRAVDVGSFFFLNYGSPDFFAEDFVGETRTF